MHIQEVNNDIYSAQNDICMAIQEWSYMTVEANNDMGTGVDGDILPETNTEAVQDSNKEVEVVQMVNECFKRYDDLPECANTTPNNEELEKEVHGKQEDEDELANLEPRVRKEDNDENAKSMEALFKEASAPRWTLKYPLRTCRGHVRPKICPTRPSTTMTSATKFVILFCPPSVERMTHDDTNNPVHEAHVIHD